MRLKGKIDETKVTTEINLNTVDRSKYKKLEMPMFLGKNPKSWVYRAEHFFEINNLPKTEKIKVVVVSFGSNEVDWYRWTHNRRRWSHGKILRGGCLISLRTWGKKVWLLI